MTTTTTATTTMPACPAWCGGDHDLNALSNETLRRYVDVMGEHLPDDATSAVSRDHENADQDEAWIWRQDVLLPDGSWRTGPVRVGMLPVDDGMTVDEARQRAAQLAFLADWADRVDLYATQEGRDDLAAELTEVHGRPVTVTPIAR